MNLRVITKIHAAGPEIGFLAKSILKPHPYSNETVIIPLTVCLLKFILIFNASVSFLFI